MSVVVSVVPWEASAVWCRGYRAPTVLPGNECWLVVSVVPWEASAVWCRGYRAPAVLPGNEWSCVCGPLRGLLVAWGLGFLLFFKEVSVTRLCPPDRSARCGVTAGWYAISTCRLEASRRRELDERVVKTPSISTLTKRLFASNSDAPKPFISRTGSLENNPGLDFCWFWG